MDTAARIDSIRPRWDGSAIRSEGTRWYNIVLIMLVYDVRYESATTQTSKYAMNFACAQSQRSVGVITSILLDGF